MAVGSAIVANKLSLISWHELQTLKCNKDAATSEAAIISLLCLLRYPPSELSFVVMVGFSFHRCCTFSLLIRADKLFSERKVFFASGNESKKRFLSVELSTEWDGMSFERDFCRILVSK